MKSVLKWLKKSFEDRRGQASSRKLTAFAGTLMFIITWYMNLFKGVQVDSIIIYSIVLITGLSLGLFTVQNIIEGIKAYRQQDYGYPPYENTNIQINNKKKDTELEIKSE